MNKPNKIIVHHSGGSDANPLQDSSNFTVGQCNDLHRTRNFSKSSLGYYVGYHYYIAKNGTYTQTRASTDEGCHCIGQNTQSIGICLAGNFDATLPTKEQITSLTSLLLKLTKDLNIPKSEIYPHRKFANKTCYGNKLSNTWAKDLIKDQTISLTPIRTAESGPKIALAQSLLKKGGYILSEFKEGVYDENMAKSVLFFQLENEIASNKELAGLRGETIGPKTITALLKLQ
jgi:N-acetyl-anhydromuramyl-L-alanine amidase AmpD